MNRQEAKAAIHGIAHNFVPRNARQYKFFYLDPADPGKNMLGYYVDHKPIIGTVIACEGDLLLVKTGRIDFVGVPVHALAGDTPSEGSKIELVPYARRRFDGCRLDAPKVETRTMADGTTYETKTMIIGGGTLDLPLEKQPLCPQLQELIRQLQALNAPGSSGYRKVVHMIADANGKDFRMLDPAWDDIIKTPPEISFHVATAKFTGRVAIRYDRGMDLYQVISIPDDGLPSIIREEVYFDDLPEVLATIFDDTSWQTVKVRTISSKKPRAASRMN